MPETGAGMDGNLPRQAHFSVRWRAIEWSIPERLVPKRLIPKRSISEAGDNHVPVTHALHPEVCQARLAQLSLDFLRRKGGQQ